MLAHRVTLDDLFSQISKGNLKQLNIIVKADVQGSVEAVKQSLEKLSNEEVKSKSNPCKRWCCNRIRRYTCKSIKCYNNCI